MRIGKTQFAVVAIGILITLAGSVFAGDDLATNTAAISADNNSTPVDLKDPANMVGKTWIVSGWKATNPRFAGTSDLSFEVKDVSVDKKGRRIASGEWRVVQIDDKGTRQSPQVVTFKVEVKQTPDGLPRITFPINGNRNWDVAVDLQPNGDVLACGLAGNSTLKPASR